MCISTSFWVLAVPKSWLNYFFQPFSTFFLILNLFRRFHCWNQQKTSENEQKKPCFCLFLKAGRHAKAARLPKGLPRNCLFSVDFLHVDQLWGVDKNTFFVHFQTFFVDFSCEIIEKVKNEKRKKVENGSKKVIRPAFVCCIHPKAGWNIQQTDSIFRSKTCLPNNRLCISNINFINCVQRFVFLQSCKFFLPVWTQSAEWIFHLWSKNDFESSWLP